ncbi:SDR family NAD(P)-dependent oxidoreductase [soil metagenome]
MPGAVVIVTGAASGQGAAHAEAIARAGATVIATDVADSGLTGVVASLVEHGLDVVAVVLDVSVAADWLALADLLASRYGVVNGLVNNAGITWRARVTEVEAEDLARVYSVNVIGPALGIRHLVPLMTAGGSIVNVGSVAGLTGHYAAAYSASKWALRGLTKPAALELGPRGIRVNTIHPGYIETPMTATAPEAFRAANIAETPLGRVGTVDDVTGVVAFLLSDASSFITGVEIAVDGGLTSHGGVKSIAESVL